MQYLSLAKRMMLLKTMYPHVYNELKKDLQYQKSAPQ